MRKYSTVSAFDSPTQNSLYAYANKKLLGVTLILVWKLYYNITLLYVYIFYKQIQVTVS